MERVSFEDVAPNGPSEGVQRRALTGPLETTDVAVNHYRLAPGEGLPAGLHAHRDQEEVFVVLDGALTFEVLLPVDEGRVPGEVTVSAGEAVRFGPGEFQSGRSAHGETTVLALGGPRDSEDVRVPLSCPDCGHDDLRLDFGDAFTFVCPDCGTERVPELCPDCGGELAATLDDEGEVVAACGVCGAAYAEPPLSEP